LQAIGGTVDGTAAAINGAEQATAAYPALEWLFSQQFGKQGISIDSPNRATGESCRSFAMIWAITGSIPWH
jgi:hypothetical protein